VKTAWALLLVACSAPPPPTTLAEPVAIVPDEQGFVDVPARSDIRTTARMFYAFQHADVSGAPLVMLTNGGPGFATSFGLLAHGTSRFSVALARGTNTARVTPTEGPWTSFANLLYIDERETGFSYGIGTHLIPSTACTMDPRSDAADFVRVVLDFLDGHPALRGAPVVLAGESYGGMRVTYMLDLLLRYRDEAPLVDDALADRIQQHYDLVFPDLAGTTVPPSRIATQFVAQVMIEPFVGGEAQVTESDTLFAADPNIAPYRSTRDPYDVRQPIGWSDALDDAAADVFANADAATLLLGGDLARVPRIGPADRLEGFRPPPLTPPRPSIDALDAALIARIGALGPSDAYFRQDSSACMSNPFGASEGALDPFVENLRWVRTFITRATYDATVCSLSIPKILAQAGFGGDVDDAPRDGVVRPGWFDVDIAASADGTEPATTVTVRFPEYAAGHMVALDQSRPLRDDVVAWLSD